MTPDDKQKEINAAFDRLGAEITATMTELLRRHLGEPDEDEDDDNEKS